MFVTSVNNATANFYVSLAQLEFSFGTILNLDLLFCLKIYWSLDCLQTQKISQDITCFTNMDKWQIITFTDWIYFQIIKTILDTLKAI